jgi:integrase
MTHVLNRNGNYYFNRRVPKELKSIDSRRFVRIALRTDSRKEAIRLATMQNEALENYWLGMMSGNTDRILYEKAVLTALKLGFSYKSNTQLATGSLEELVNRLKNVGLRSTTPDKVSALLGGVEPPQVKLDQLLEYYQTNAKGKTVNKSANQLRKWIHPKKLALKNIIKLVGNKQLKELSRDDLIKYRDWWLYRIQKENIAEATANRNILAIKAMVESVNESMQIGLDTTYLFKNIVLPNENPGKRLPFQTDYIRNVLFHEDSLNGLNDQAKSVLYAISETGAGVSELVGLLPEDIVLDHEIPHIIIRPSKNKTLKTKFRARAIPLVGFALDAFKTCPKGFDRYRDRPDELSTLLSKYLRENKLLPSKHHTVYSLRHSFQDRLLHANAPDRLQADLMGHKFQRPAYGEGSTLQHKLEWLLKIQLK